MPKKKLTLSVEEEAVRKARWFSRKHRTSISRLVSDYLSSLGERENSDTPIVSRIRGVMNSDVRVEDYEEYLIEKYTQ